jgi:hypothetical protein
MSWYANGVGIPMIPQSGDDPGTGQVQICDLIWTDVNSTITDTTSGGTIPIATSSAEFFAEQNAGLPVAAYWQFDSNNSERGLLYNQSAARLIQPPTGFRLPTSVDFITIFNSPCNLSNPNQNRYGANPGNWDPSQLTDTTELGDANLNINGYGNITLTSGLVFFSGDTRNQLTWTSTIAANGVNTSKGINTGNANPYLISLTDSVNGAAHANYIRFVKDV